MKFFSMSQVIDKLPSEIHIVPIGEWKERGFRITAEDCQDIVRNFKAFGIKLVIDYEHQSLYCVDNGEPAPAAGWIGKLEQRDNGVWASDLEWTDQAKGFIESKQYRYISPVIVFDDHDPHSDIWIGCSLHSVALTNTPYFRDDLEPFINKSAGKPANNNPAPDRAAKEMQMTLEEQIAALKAELAAKDAKVADLETRIAAKDAELAEADQTRMVDDAIAAKKLLPAQKEVGLIMAKQGKEAFDKFIAANVIPDLGKVAGVPQVPGKSSDPKAEYIELMKRPADLIKLQAENPEKFEALRKAYYGG
jgi:phage I-like protein